MENGSIRFRLNEDDLIKWAKNTALFSTPALIVFLTTLQSGADYRLAFGALSQALIASTIDILKKFLADSSPTP